MNGVEYYVDYASIMGMMGLLAMHHTTWDSLVSWVGTHVKRLTEWSLNRLELTLRNVVIKTTGVLALMDFIYVGGHHSNNSSATLHDVESDPTAWFTHCTKCGKGSNWEEYHPVQKGDILDELLGKVKSNGYNLDQIVMDHDTTSNVIVCYHFPDIHIAYCSNHSAKSFHYELNKTSCAHLPCGYV